mmetsp:Transcript_39578/g.94725  ORF Transcript_39578/g.94725 Transcript_39578/m.94725 type:complete len:230 (+) Transcript_39578:310-999(+)
MMGPAAGRLDCERRPMTPLKSECSVPPPRASGASVRDAPPLEACTAKPSADEEASSAHASEEEEEGPLAAGAGGTGCSVLGCTVVPAGRAHVASGAGAASSSSRGRSTWMSGYSASLLRQQTKRRSGSAAAGWTMQASEASAVSPARPDARRMHACGASVFHTYSAPPSAIQATPCAPAAKLHGSCRRAGWRSRWRRAARSSVGSSPGDRRRCERAASRLSAGGSWAWA